MAKFPVRQCQLEFAFLSVNLGESAEVVYTARSWTTLLAAEVCPTDRTKDQCELRSVDLTAAGKTDLGWGSLVVISGRSRRQDFCPISRRFHELMAF